MPQPGDDIVFSDKHSMSDYIIGNKIGQGAYAVVHIGMHRKLNKKVALKVVYCTSIVKILSDLKE